MSVKFSEYVIWQTTKCASDPQSVGVCGAGVDGRVIDRFFGGKCSFSFGDGFEFEVKALGLCLMIFFSLEMIGCFGVCCVII